MVTLGHLAASFSNTSYYPNLSSSFRLDGSLSCWKMIPHPSLRSRASGAGFHKDVSVTAAFTFLLILTSLPSPATEKHPHSLMLPPPRFTVEMIKAVVLDPKNGFDVDRTLAPQDVLKLTEICLQRLTERCSPFLDTVKMQVYFELNYTTRREFLAEIHDMMESKLNRLSREITNSRVKTRDQVETLYQKITHYMLSRSGMGSPRDSDVLNQTTAALQSVFPQTELGSFMALLKIDKEQQLKDLSMLVTGIRLFNRASMTKDKVEPSVQDLVPEALMEVLPASPKGLEQELGDCERLVWRYTSALETLTEPGTTAPAERGVSVDLLRQALYNVRQHQALLNILMADVRESVQRVKLLKSELMARLMMLKDTVKSKRAVPAPQVFPMFRSVSRHWSSLQDEAELLHIFRNLALRLHPFLSSQAQIFSEKTLDGLLQGSEIKSDAERKHLCEEVPIDQAEVRGLNTEWLVPDHSSHPEPQSLQYNGFCGHTLVCRDGLLLPGNPRLGLLKYKEKLYAFSSRDSALQFASAPEHYILEVAERAKRSPELIQLLCLHRQFSCIAPYAELQSGEHLMPPITQSSSGTQTVTHPVESHIDKTYQWNEWELRRKALKLADLRTRQTHSTQTNSSHLKRDSCTQTYLHKDAAGQTKQDGASNVPRPLVYLSGLRGQRDGPVVRVDLTKALDE
ncbi:cilia- and flagella-associated protein 206 [Eucyclogobius newberryi]|uniref:cilia- and flagella-associated protein 206 n=1 Tax=Eucyclogobius newberryi TaxID=166745 RepID=UPI003B58F096